MYVLLNKNDDDDDDDNIGEHRKGFKPRELHIEFSALMVRLVIKVSFVFF